MKNLHKDMSDTDTLRTCKFSCKFSLCFGSVRLRTPAKLNLANGKEGFMQKGIALLPWNAFCEGGSTEICSWLHF